MFYNIGIYGISSHSAKLRAADKLSTGFLLPSGLVPFQGRLIHKIVIQWLGLILIFSAHLIRSAIKKTMHLTVKCCGPITWPCLTAKYRLCIPECIPATSVLALDTSAAI